MQTVPERTRYGANNLQRPRLARTPRGFSAKAHVARVHATVSDWGANAGIPRGIVKGEKPRLGSGGTDLIGIPVSAWAVAAVEMDEIVVERA